ncbi:AMP-binding protein [Allosaccharopolyspora coralli]|uniref:AMP-binding protein n=1 Tax=Allosaccharopolyspora coralli TaxID=2665642 RepID=A0A5Q3Q5E4_9PSEU|nr:fatty acid--CoA ligase family protein [Allosaccharopolyspora coralli]QGK69030.1 AMP-binding protein [Allosaccharopolyspora coralli]
MPAVPPLLREHAGAPSVTTDDGTHSWEALVSSAHGAAEDLRRAGVHAGDRVAIDVDGALPRLSWLLGADLLAAASLVVDPSWSGRERKAVLADVEAAAHVTVPPGPPEARTEPVGDDETLFYLPTTSGSSGRPKVLVRTRASWQRSFEAFEIGTTPDDVVLVPGPLSSSLFLFGTAHALHRGLAVRLLERWSPVAAAEAGREATVVHLVPAMLDSMLSVLERNEPMRARCRLRKVVCGGARMEDALRRRLADTLPDCEAVEYYGSAEHSVVAIRHDDGPLRPVSGVDVRVVDGVLQVRSGLVHGGSVEAAKLRPVEPGWSSTGDLATLHEDGSLTVHGRAGAVVSSGGTLVPAEEVEAVLRTVTGVREVIVVGSPHGRLESTVTAVVEPDPESPPRLRDLRGHAREALAPGKRPRRWLATPSIPRTASGKPARADVSRSVLDGTLTVQEWP